MDDPQSYSDRPWVVDSFSFASAACEMAHGTPAERLKPGIAVTRITVTVSSIASLGDVDAQPLVRIGRLRAQIETAVAVRHDPEGPR